MHSFGGQANYMHWTVDKIPDQSLMNTDGWKYIIPQLYEQYPDYDMNLRMKVTSPPIIRISDRDIDTTISADLIIEVLNSGEVVPVTCISLVCLIIMIIIFEFINFFPS